MSATRIHIVKVAGESDTEIAGPELYTPYENMNLWRCVQCCRNNEANVEGLNLAQLVDHQRLIHQAQGDIIFGGYIKALAQRVKEIEAELKAEKEKVSS